MSRDRKRTSAAKKAAVLGTGKKNRTPLLLMAVCAALVIGGGVLFLSRGGPQASSTPSGALVHAPGGEVTYPVSHFDDGTCRFYEYATEDGLKIRYFILKSSDGVIRAAFDACDSCWPSGKGYYQEGDEVVCRNCRQRFASIKVNELKGGCNPSPLERTVRDGKVVIRVEDILEGKRYFDFRKEG